MATILRDAGPAYCQKHGESMPPSHRKTIRDLLACRTPALGGQVRECDRCGEIRYSYHSCRNRHCPKCQGEKTEAWLEAHRSRLPSCPYYLLTFTLPKELRSLVRSNQETVYDLLIRAAAQSVLQLARDRKFLGGVPGILAVLHTWTRDLRYHPHVHLLVTGGGIAEDRTVWRMTRNPAFLLPGRVLSVLFRGKLYDGLRREGLLESVPRRIWRRRWVVHAKFAGTGTAVLEYLSRYVHRVAIPNSRLEAFDGDFVTFRYRDSRSGVLRRCRLHGHEFLRRFLQHVLPRGFVKVRSYGIFASSKRDDLLAAHELLDRKRVAENRPTPGELHGSTQDPDDPDPICPACRRGRLRVTERLRPVRGASLFPMPGARAPPAIATERRPSPVTSRRA